MFTVTNSAQQLSDALTERYLPIDPSLIRLAYLPAQPWPMVDTPGHIAAYQNLSFQIVKNLWPNTKTRPSITQRYTVSLHITFR